MKKLVLLFMATLLLTSCSGNKKQEKQEADAEVVQEEVQKKEFVKVQNYAVVFKWKTEDEKLVEDNAMKQADQLLELWENNIVENVYYDSDAKVEKFSYFPNITFVVKAENEAAAKTILDELAVVKNNIATYTTYPVGDLWLKRNTEKILKDGVTKSYVSVWTTNAKPSDELIKSQNADVLKLWENGTIENAYFDIEGTQVENNKTDFVFFVNADTEEKAAEILNKLPFVKNDIASYKLHQVGVFWMGVNE